MADDARATVIELLQQRRFGQAQYELRQLVEQDPTDAPTIALLALCLAELEQFEEATQHAQRAVELEPDLAYCHWTLGLILAARHRLKDALREAETARRQDPDDPDHFALLARCYGGLGQWEEALAAADQCLDLDPDHIGCSNIRALALQQRGRAAEADQAFIDAASLDAENDFARAGRGWAALHRGSAPAEALPHFYHALHLNPTSEYARTGLLAALKARNPVYRLMLRYFLWMEALRPRTRMLVIFGGIFLYGNLRRIAQAQPALAPVIYPLLGLYLLFILLSWTADPLFDFLLRFDPAGRAMVTEERRIASNYVIGTLCSALVALIVGLATGSERALLFALVAGFLVIPIAGVFQCERGWPRNVMTAYTGLIALAGFLGALLPGDAGSGLLVIALLGAAVGSWLGRWLASKVPAR